jgi:ATP-dependent Clp protease protease subunit
MRETLNKLLAKDTGQIVEKVALDVDRDYILEPDNAIKYGLIDSIIEHRDLKVAGLPTAPSNGSDGAASLVR